MYNEEPHTLHVILLGCLNEGDEVRRTCSTPGGNENGVQNFDRKSERGGGHDGKAMS